MIRNAAEKPEYTEARPNSKKKRRLALTPPRLAANRRNSQLSTGPRTAAGKAVSSRNALRHGALSSRHVIIPGLERPAEWEEFRAGIIDTLSPAGLLEDILAERAAGFLWRLRRLDRFVNEEIRASWAEERAAFRGAQEEARKAKTWADLLETFPSELRQKKDDEPLQKEMAFLLFDLAEPPVLKETALLLLDLVKVPVRGADVLRFPWPCLPPGVTPDVFDHLTAGLLRRNIAALAERAKKTEEDLIAEAVRAARGRQREAEEKFALAKEQLRAARRSCLMPEEALQERSTRYEVHLERSLYRTLHELERRQAGRSGRIVPPPLTVDVTLDQGSGGA